MSRIVGIDLGTSTSEIACIIDGKPFVIPNTADKLVTPSVVHIRENGETLVGEEAAEYLLTQPECTFMEVKRLTGSDTVLKAHGKEYSPEDIQAILLKYMVKCAEEYLGEKIDRAVITVPAYFTDKQRRATVESGKLAGLTVERVINEPTAAALDYGLMNLEECKNVLVYDFGGGTLDVTVLELFEGVIDVKASNGDNRLGGKDFDEIIMKRLFDPGKDARAAMRLKMAAETCKVDLSINDHHEVLLPFLATKRGSTPVSVERVVTRDEFEEWIREKVESTKTPIVTALEDAGLTASDLDIVLLVGGSTRVPCVMRMVAETLNIEPQTIVDPDLTVARGAAIQAAILEGRLSGGQELVLTDVCPYTLGTSVLQEGDFEDRLVFDPIIPRNITIPAEKTKTYYPAHDYQTAVTIDVYQGESRNIEQNEHLGEAHLSGIPRARRGKEAVEVTFAYDMNGILQVRARSVSTGKEVNTVINMAGAKAKAPPDLSKWEEAPQAKYYRPALRKAEKLIAAGNEDADELRDIIDQIKEALIGGDDSLAEELRAELIGFMNDL